MSVLKHTMMSLDYGSKVWNDPELNFSILLHDVGKRYCHDNYGNAYNHEEEGVRFVEAFCEKWKVPSSYKNLSVLVTKYHGKVHGSLGRGSNKGMRPVTIMKLFEETNALAKPERFEKILKACIADARGRGATPEQIKEFEGKPYPQADYMRECLQAVLNLNTKEISSKLLERGVEGKTIGLEIRAARIAAIRSVQNKWKSL